MVRPSTLSEHDGFTRGRFDCTFERIPESNSWTVEVVDALSGALVFETVPVTSRIEARELALSWLDFVCTDSSLPSVLERHDIITEADAAVLRVIPSLETDEFE